MAALGEGLLLAKSGGATVTEQSLAQMLFDSAGISQQKYLEIIGNHPMLGNGLFKMFGPKMLEAQS